MGAAESSTVPARAPVPYRGAIGLELLQGEFLVSCIMRIWIFSFVLGLSMCGQAEADWPEFRGPHGDGHVVAEGGTQPSQLPLTWSESENVVWKTAIPYKGWSTPVIMNGLVWLATAKEDGHDFYAIAVDEASGKIRFNKHLFHADKPEPLGNKVNCYASPTPAVELGRVYFHFGSYGTACLDTATAAVVWERQDLPCRHFRGPGSSVIIFKDLLILTMDGIDLQYLVALDKKTGKTIWKTDRTAQWNDLAANGKPIGDGDLRKAYSTPLVCEVGGKPMMVTRGRKPSTAMIRRLVKSCGKCSTAARGTLLGLWSGLVWPSFRPASARLSSLPFG